ncbi:VaFE repeat-containing surface-anchored protein [Corynebacterium suranareeae]|uniref:VaFE repeat-containing surface-anchored protein n=1 Tax=Corynebacterium suranareeae TaxID=2506452 RepID=UPI001E308812|nr:VaFE repeat-containing surface-anchored protein [Corynebacterium suranareeae]
MALWIPITVMLAVMGLILALLPVTATAARADEGSAAVETVVETTPVSDGTVSLDVSLADEPFVYYADEDSEDITSNDVADEANETPVEDTEETPTEGPSVDPSITEVEEGAEEAGEPSLLDQVLSVFNIGPMAAPNEFDVTVEGIVIPGGQVGDNIYVGDRVNVYGTWGAQPGIDVNTGDTFVIEIPDSLQIIPLAFPLVDSAGHTWGTCTPVGNQYNCVITDKPAGQFGGSGEWQGSATAIREDASLGIQARGGDINLSKTGEMNLDGPETVGLGILWTVGYSNTQLSTLTDDIVLTDTYSPNMAFCADPAVTNVASFPYTGATVTDLGNNTMEVRIPRPANGFNRGDAVSIQFTLCTASGGMDAVGEEYVNTIADDVMPNSSGLEVDAIVYQDMQTSGTATGVPFGSFNLQKIIDPVVPGTDNIDFVIQVEEFAPGNFPDGPVEATYNVTVNSDGTVVSGQNARPAGWTIRLTELRDQNPSIPDYIWGDATFTGVDSSGIDANGNPWGAFATNLQTNVAIQLTNKAESPTPEIGTTAQVTGSQDNVLPLTGGEVVDTVAYKNLLPNTEYVLDGEIVDSTGNLTGIVDSTTFTTPAAAPGQSYVDGTVDVTFTITGAQAEQYAGQNLVVYETLYLATDLNTVVAEHKDVNDAGQTFTVDRTPEIGTKAVVTGHPDNILPLTGGEVVDTVSYTDLRPNTEYVLNGEIMHVDAAGAVTATGIEGTATFTTPAAAAGESYVSGTAEVAFTISGAQAEQYVGEKLVVFEDLFLAGTKIAEHRDATDEDQTFWVERTPEIGTKALVTGHADNILPLTGGEVVDTVSYTDLRPSTEYVLNGEIMHVDAAGAVTATGIEGTATFTTPAAAAGESYVSGTAEVAFTISGAQAEQYVGEKLVVFEDLFLAGTKIAEHRDAADVDQTFWVERVPEIGTKVLVTGNPDKVLALTGGTVVDTVSYTDLRPNTEYTVTGELMHVDAAGVVTATGITGETTFTTPVAAAGENYVSGTVEVTFTISGAQAEAYAGEKLVVFEDLFRLGVKVADHRNPNDEDQTFEVQPPTTVVFIKEVTGPKGGEITADSEAEFQIRAEWVDQMGVTQTRTFTIKPGVPFTLENMPLNTEIKLTEIGAQTGVGNIKWGDIIWSGTGVTDENGSSAGGTLIITDPDADNVVNLENKTSSTGLIIIPIPIPGIDFGGSSDQPTPDEVVAGQTPTPDAPEEQVAGLTPEKPAPSKPAEQVQSKGLASTGANVAWLAGGAVLLLLIGAGLVLRGRKNQS